MFTKEDFLFKFDLKTGYHHLDIFELHQKYLGFAWREGEVLSYFVFTVLPFGLPTACYAIFWWESYKDMVFLLLEYRKQSGLGLVTLCCILGGQSQGIQI